MEDCDDISAVTEAVDALEIFRIHHEANTARAEFKYKITTLSTRLNKCDGTIVKSMLCRQPPCTSSTKCVVALFLSSVLLRQQTDYTSWQR
ncbi:hypothetical protein N7517_009966 [Penicillium concentricum]|uniref:Uncharacterized protein n=1 Tax=Penicillium concentricum TaxID=293559 RepID=A0A9W9UZE0_9EURO|nr:uncharacterized protein N7517_009966 [Penicillium concentricum]KAJ5360775.1 hypothetical protein N7517_009966 [Penicillium concentricum]